MMATKPGTPTASPARDTSNSKVTQTKETSKTLSTRRPTAQATPTVVEPKDAIVAKPALRKKELIDLVVERSGAKKKDAKPAIEAMLAVLGEALAEGRELNLRPLGKVKVTRQAEKPNGTVLVCRVRQPKPGAPESADSVD